MTKCYPQNAEKNYQCNKASEYSHTLHQRQRTKKNIALVNTENGEVITMYYSNQKNVYIAVILVCRLNVIRLLSNQISIN